MTKILVTGASGFIGRAITPRLIANGFEVHAVSRRQVAATEGVNWHQIDLLEPEDAGEVCRQVRPTHLLHLAWITERPDYLDVRDELLMAHCQRRSLREFSSFGGRRFVGIGTSAEYAPDPSGTYREDSPLRPPSLYGATKAALGMLVTHAAESVGVTSAWMRLFYLFGEGEPSDRLVPRLIHAALFGESVGVRLADERDYLALEDVASALTHVIMSNATGMINLGSGRGISVREVAEQVAKATGVLQRFAVPSERDEAPPSRIVADVSRLRDLGWREELSFADAVSAAVHEYQQTSAKGDSSE